MKAKYLTPLFFLFFYSLAAAAPVRVWTDISGKHTVTAELVRVEAGIAHLKKSDGRVVKVPVEKLSVSDRELISGSSLLSRFEADRRKLLAQVQDILIKESIESDVELRLAVAQRIIASNPLSVIADLNNLRVELKRAPISDDDFRARSLAQINSTIEKAKQNMRQEPVVTSRTLSPAKQAEARSPPAKRTQHNPPAARIQLTKLVTLDDHKAFSANLDRILSLRNVVRVLSEKVDSLKRSKSSAITKSEFETTARYNQRLAERNAAIDSEMVGISKELEKARATFANLGARTGWKANQDSIYQSVAEIELVVAATMGVFDADNGQVTSFSPRTTVLGTYHNGGNAQVVVRKTLPKFPTSIAMARKLRDASSKNELVCLIRLKDVKFKVSRVVGELPGITNEQIGHAAIAIGLYAIGKAINPDFEPEFVPPLPEGKKVFHYEIEILDYSSIRYTGFYGKGGQAHIR